MHIKKLRKAGLGLAVWLLSSAFALHGQTVKSADGATGFDPMAGNLVGKSEAHDAAKQAKIKQDPIAYQKQGGNPDAIRPVEQVEQVEAPAKLPVFAVAKSWKLENIEAIPAAGSSPTLTELADETMNVKKDFPVQITHLNKSAGGMVRISGKEKMDLRGHEKLSAGKATWTFEREGCASCTKVIDLQYQEVGGKLIYVMESEDADSPFAYRFTFSPIQTR